MLLGASGPKSAGVVLPKLSPLPRLVKITTNFHMILL